MVPQISELGRFLCIRYMSPTTFIAALLEFLADTGQIIDRTLHARHISYRSLKDFSMYEKDKPRLLSCGFRQAAAKMIERVARTHDEGNADQVRNLLKVRLCHKEHLSSLKKISSD